MKIIRINKFVGGRNMSEKTAKQFRPGKLHFHDYVFNKE